MSYVLKKNYVLKTIFQRSFRDNHEDLGLCADLLNTFYIPNPFRGFIPYRSAHSAYTYNTHKPLWLSKKTMRAKSLEDLIFAGSRGKNPSQRAKVILTFDNTEKIFPAPGDTFEVSRSIKRGGGGGYRINGKRATRQQILNALAAANIDPDGTNQFVLQGKIVELTHMNPENRRQFIEELIGLQKYDEMKDATMKELERRNET